LICLPGSETTCALAYPIKGSSVILDRSTLRCSQLISSARVGKLSGGAGFEYVVDGKPPRLGCGLWPRPGADMHRFEGNLPSRIMGRESQRPFFGGDPSSELGGREFAHRTSNSASDRVVSLRSVRNREIQYPPNAFRRIGCAADGEVLADRHNVRRQSGRVSLRSSSINERLKRGIPVELFSLDQVSFAVLSGSTVSSRSTKVIVRVVRGSRHVKGSTFHVLARRCPRGFFCIGKITDIPPMHPESSP